MWNWRKIGTGLMAACVAAILAGCPSTPTDGTTEKPATPSPTTESPGENLLNPSPAVETPKPPEPPPPAAIPEVVMSQTDRQTCLVDVGDAMPEAQLPDLEGNLHATPALYGEKLTVVFFWSVGDTEYNRLSALESLEDMQKDVLEAYSAKGVRVIAVNEREPADMVRQVATGAGAACPILLDADGGFFAKVATEKVPRIYLLDRQGTILWFDIEYSRTTRDNLKLAIQVALGEI